MNADQIKAWDAAYGPKNEAYLQARPSMSETEIIKWKYQRYVKDYLRCVKSVDDGIGRVLDYLDEAGLADNTVVIYSSDQGWYLGEHGWFDKRWMYEESLKTPLLVRWPGKVKPGSINDDIVSNLDFAETFLDIAGVEVPSRHAGPQPGAAAARQDAGGLAKVVLLSLLRKPRCPQRGPTLRRDQRQAQADSLLCARRRTSSTTGSCLIWRRIPTNCVVFMGIRTTPQSDPA